MSPTELLSMIVAFGSIMIVLIIIFVWGSEKRKRMKISAEPPKVNSEVEFPFKIKRSVTQDVVKEAENKLRILGLEKEILSYAIRRLYEAQAEGKITEEERDNLAEKYKEDMKRINEEISRGESLIALNELEKMQADLLKLFNERFDELNKRIEELRLRSGIEQPKEAIEGEKAVSVAAPEVSAVPEQPTEGREVARKKPTPPAKSEAERKVEQIMAEVEKVLARLEQMEVSE